MDTKNVSITSIKNTAKANLKETLGITKSTNHICILAIEDEIRREFLVKGLSDIGVGVIVYGNKKDYNISNVVNLEKINSNILHGFDFFVYDNNMEGIDVVNYLTHGIVPIMPEKNTYSGILKEFNPMKFEGNGFFWKKDSPFCIFEKVITYLENIKFPEDKRVLLKNVTSTF